MTVEELKALELPIDADAMSALYVGAAVDWLNTNTTLEIDKGNLKESIAALPDGAKLFLCRYRDVMTTDGTVASESIAGMSQTFNNTSKTALLYQLAIELIPSYLKSQVQSIGNVSKWK
jgi:hypothetical protein